MIWNLVPRCVRIGSALEIELLPCKSGELHDRWLKGQKWKTVIFVEWSRLTTFLHEQTFHDLYNWSVTRRADFWQDIWHELGLVHEGTYDVVVDESLPMDAIPHWFRGTRLNFAENILYTHQSGDPFSHPSKVGKEDDKIATTEVREGATEIRSFTWKQLREAVGLLSNALRANGVRKGDRVAVVASNSFDTLVVFLAITALGGLFSSSSTDMGTKGVLDRLTQIKPKFVFFDEGAVYNGKTIDLRPKMKEVVDGLRGISEFQGIVSQPRFLDQRLDVSDVPFTVTLKQFLTSAKGDNVARFERVEFRDPFLVVYSSGTTVRQTYNLVTNRMLTMA